jgi:electron-transferring-flavoprotein dehydrogenase
MGAPLETPVTDDKFLILDPRAQLSLPMFAMPPLHAQPRLLHRLSATSVAGWATQAEALGVEIYPGFAASEPGVRR